MKFERETPEQRMERLSQWKRKFAWLPVQIDHVTFWLQWVERRAFFRFSLMRCAYDAWWEYRPVQSSDLGAEKQ